MPKLCRSGLAIVLNQIYPLVAAAAGEWRHFSVPQNDRVILFLTKYAYIIANIWQFSHKKSIFLHQKSVL